VGAGREFSRPPRRRRSPAARKQDFKLSPLADANRQVRQASGRHGLCGIAEETAQDARMKTLVKNNCTGCHTLSYILQHRFEEDGWYKVIELMKNVTCRA